MNCLVDELSRTSMPNACIHPKSLTKWGHIFKSMNLAQKIFYDQILGGDQKVCALMLQLFNDIRYRNDFFCDLLI